MEIHVALDIYRESVVRMVRGRVENLIVYSRDPLGFATRILDTGLRRIHLVDLEAAIEAKSVSENVLKLAADLKSLGAFVTIAGGVKTRRDLEKALEVADRAVVGSSVYKGVLRGEEVVEMGGSRVVLAVDARDGRVVISGWREELSLTVAEAIEHYSRIGFQRFLMTSTTRDGTMSGLSEEELSWVPRSYRERVIYAGGVRSLSDIRLLAREGFGGVVLGRAFYEKLVDPRGLLEVESVEIR
ncbi:MAG: HisA/HisF-related TIM barrel protein [Acidilobaceae archaeon]